MPQCLNCRSQRVTKGIVGDSDGPKTPAVFLPQGFRFWSLVLSWSSSFYPRLAKEGFACLDCGLVWSSTAPDKLAAFIHKHCDQ
jgi:hypothetical protein